MNCSYLAFCFLSISYSCCCIGFEVVLTAPDKDKPALYIIIPQMQRLVFHSIHPVSYRTLSFFSIFFYVQKIRYRHVMLFYFSCIKKKKIPYFPSYRKTLRMEHFLVALTLLKQSSNQVSNNRNYYYYFLILSLFSK